MGSKKKSMQAMGHGGQSQGWVPKEPRPATHRACLTTGCCAQGRGSSNRPGDAQVPPLRAPGGAEWFPFQSTSAMRALPGRCPLSWLRQGPKTFSTAFCSWLDTCVSPAHVAASLLPPFPGHSFEPGPPANLGPCCKLAIDSSLPSAPPLGSLRHRTSPLPPLVSSGDQRLHKSQWAAQGVPVLPPFRGSAGGQPERDPRARPLHQPLPPWQTRRKERPMHVSLQACNPCPVQTKVLSHSH